jgi:hypothetical protein
MSLTNQTIDELIPIVDQANSSIIKLLGVAARLEPNPHLQLLRRNVNMLIQASPMCLLKEAQPHIWKYKDVINDRDEKTFLSLELEEFVHDPSQIEFQGDILSVLKSKFSNMSAEEKNVVWEELHALLVCVLKYTILQNKTPGMQLNK